MTGIAWNCLESLWKEWTMTKESLLFFHKVHCGGVRFFQARNRFGISLESEVSAGITWNCLESNGSNLCVEGIASLEWICFGNHHKVGDSESLCVLTALESPWNCTESLL